MGIFGQNFLHLLRDFALNKNKKERKPREDSISQSQQSAYKKTT